MSLVNYNLHKLITRSKLVVNQAKKNKLNSTQQYIQKPQKTQKKSSKLEPNRKNPIFKLSSSKGFEPKAHKELRINTLPDEINGCQDLCVEYQTPKFSCDFTVNIESRQKKQDLFSTFGFRRKGKVCEGKTQRIQGVKSKYNKENKENKVQRVNQEGLKQKKKKFLSTLSFGEKRERVTSDIRSGKLV